MNQKVILIFIIALAVLILLTGWFAFVGYEWSWGPFSSLSEERFKNLGGNKMEITVEKNEPNELTGKNILFLGSSVTYGASSCGKSFVEYISEKNGASYIKEAVSGTTLADINSKSYISRLKTISADAKIDLMVCQLSTNDATQNITLGTVSADGNYDTKTVCGAIQYIIDYAKKTWNCPVIFYTNSYYESENYAKMVAKLKEIQEVTGIGVIDLYTDEEFNDISEENYSLYMADKIHPTRAGYYYWWTPKMEAEMCLYLNKNA